MKKQLLRCSCLSPSSFHPGFALLACTLPRSFVVFSPTPTQGCDKYSFLLSMIFEASIHHFTFHLPLFLCLFSCSSLLILSRLSVSRHICVSPFLVCHHKLPIISLSPPQCHSLSIGVPFVLLPPCPSRPPTFLCEQRGFSPSCGVVPFATLKFILSPQAAVISVCTHIHIHLLYTARHMTCSSSTFGFYESGLSQSEKT